MAYSTPLNRTAPNLLRQPFMIAALASVGIHGLVAANFEKISLFPRTAELPPSVQLMELSPLQISRLYPPPPEKLSLGTISAPPSLSTLGPSPTLPEFPATLSTPTFPSFPTSPTLPPVSSRLPSIPSSPGISSFPLSNVPSFPDSIPIPNDLPIFSTEPQFKDKNNRELDRFRDRQLALENLSPEDREIIDNMTPDVYGADIFNTQPPGGEAEENYGIPPQRYATLNPDTPTTTTEETPVDPENFKGSILSNLQQSQKQIAANSETPVTPSSDNATQGIGEGREYAAWGQQLLQDYPNLVSKGYETLEIVSPAEACDQQLSGKAVVGVVMGTGGEVLRGPKLLSSTGYSVLNNAAMAKVEEVVVTQLSGQVRNQPAVFWYAFDFNPDNCATPQPASEATPPPAVQQPQPVETTPVETQPPVDVNPSNEVEESFPSSPEMTIPEPEPEPEPEPQLESSPPVDFPAEPESESFPPVDFPAETELESSPSPTMPSQQQLESDSLPATPPIEEESETNEVTPPSTPTEHKGSLLESLTTPYTEPEE